MTDRDNMSVSSTLSGRTPKSVEAAQLRAQVKLLNKTHVELKNKILKLEDKVSQQAEELAKKDENIAALQQGLQDNLAMLQELEELEAQAMAEAQRHSLTGFETPKKKELKRQIKAEKEKNQQLTDQLAKAQEQIHSLEVQLASARSTVAVASAANGNTHNNNNSYYSTAIALPHNFIAEMELISELFHKKIQEFKRPPTATATTNNTTISTRKSVTILDPHMAQKQGEARGKWKKGIRRVSMVRHVSSAQKDKFARWARILRRMDPRFQILEFFDQVAQRGADALVDCDVHITGTCTQRCLDADAEVVVIRKRSKRQSFVDVFASERDAFSASNVFNQAGVFTVWRPTSNDSIRKMIVGDGVGKGLDIKGKSAKKGHFSGFVPFLQLHEDKHKSMVRTIPNTARMRVYYTTKDARDYAHNHLLAVSVDMLTTYTKAQKTIARIKDAEATGKAPTNPDAIADNERLLQDALSKYMWDMEDPSMTLLDEYAPKRYGIELPQRLFFEAYVMRGNCQREPGTIHETGRASEPAFQDMNMETLRNFKPGAPRPVVLLKSDDIHNTMDPRYLLIAYEDNGFVKPVVSDFDCFLVGTRRIMFDKPLPSDQVELMKWCIQMIENILDIPPSSENWTMRWLEQLKKAYEDGFHCTFPKYGFADPKSYSIMAHAIDRLTGHGSVRHGAECFNFYFPQDLDDEFLVVTNNQSNGPWTKYDKEGLLTFLSKKIDEGFMFPVNPKWILCDPGWKQLYDKQMRSHNKTTILAMNSWYPRDSGVREMIDRIHKKHPKCFQMDKGPYKMEKPTYSPLRKACQDGEEISAEEAMDMAQLEVNHNRVLQKAIKVMNGILFANRLQQSSIGGLNHS